MSAGSECEPGMEPVLCKVLQCCIIIAVALFAIGLGCLLVTANQGGLSEQFSLQQIVDSITSVRPEGIIGLGIIVVVATPLLRIFATTVMSLRRKDRLIALLTILSFLSITVAFAIKTLL
ncbi:MAG: DUF1634 domain-containing protein [Thermoplasmata archaeon]